MRKHLGVNHHESESEKVTQSCLTLCDPIDYIHRVLQARILEWVACPFSKGSSQPRNQTGVSCIAGGFFTKWTIREAKNCREAAWQLFSVWRAWRGRCWAVRGPVESLQGRRLDVGHPVAAVQVIAWTPEAHLTGRVVPKHRKQILTMLGIASSCPQLQTVMSIFHFDFM